MHVVVLCGGLGTRLRPAVEDLPKVLAPVSGRPFLYFVLERLRRDGFEEVVLSTGYLGEIVDAAVEAMELEGLRVRCIREPEPQGTAGALRYVIRSEGMAGPFVAMNGDTMFSGSLRRLVHYHHRHAARATIALVRVDDPARYGTVEIDADSGTVTAFLEKGASHREAAWINAGAYVLVPDVLNLLDANEGSLEREVFPRVIGSGLYGCAFPDAAMLDIGVPEDYYRAQEFLQRLNG